MLRTLNYKWERNNLVYFYMETYLRVFEKPTGEIEFDSDEQTKHTLNGNWDNFDITDDPDNDLFNDLFDALRAAGINPSRSNFDLSSNVLISIQMDYRLVFQYKINVIRLKELIG